MSFRQASSTPTQAAALQGGACLENSSSMAKGNAAEAQVVAPGGLQYAVEGCVEAAAGQAAVLAAAAAEDAMQADKKQVSKDGSSRSKLGGLTTTTTSSIAASLQDRAADDAIGAPPAPATAKIPGSNKAMLPARRNRGSTNKQPPARPSASTSTLSTTATAGGGAVTVSSGGSVCSLWGSCRSALISCLLPGVLAIVALHHLLRGLALAAAMTKGGAVTCSSTSFSRNRYQHRPHHSLFPTRPHQGQDQPPLALAGGEVGDNATQQLEQPWFLAKAGEESYYSSNKGGRGCAGSKHGKPWLLRGVRGYLTEGPANKHSGCSHGSWSRALVARSAAGAELLLMRRGMPCGVSSGGDSSSRRGCGRLQQLGDVGGAYGVVDLSSSTCYSS
jgi:hypothetical protein